MGPTIDIKKTSCLFVFPNNIPVYIKPFRTAVPFWGQTTQILSSLSPKRDCGYKRVNIVVLLTTAKKTGAVGIINSKK